MDFEPGLQPPLHIPVAFGSVRAKKSQQQQAHQPAEEEAGRCLLCRSCVKVRSLSQLKSRLAYATCRTYIYL